MFYRAKNGVIKIGQTEMDYISFGRGAKNMVIIPGLGDGLKTVRGLALPLAWMYRGFARDYRVYVFSRKNRMTKGFTTRDMANDTKEAMDKLGIANADVIGISQGGMIAQCLAIDYPKAVNRLVLAVTASRSNGTMQSVVQGWIEMAEAGDYRSLMIDTAENSYTEKRLRRYRRLYPIITRMGKPKDFSRFIIQANACLGHDMYEALDRIKCPVLVIGADNDRVVGADASKEIGERIENSVLSIYHGFGHGVYEEAKDFNGEVLRFLNSLA